jgi:hypothetical protein
METTIPNDDHILRLACAEFEQRHRIVLRLMALKHSTDAEMRRLVAALEHRREAIDAIQALPVTTIEGHREKMWVSLDIWSLTSEDDIDDQFVRTVVRGFVESDVS